MKKYLICLSVTGFVLFPACAGRSQTTKKTTAPAAPEASFRRVDTSEGTSIYIVARGVGYPDMALGERQKKQRRNKARRDALVEAQSKMLFMVSDFVLKGGMTVARRMRSDKDFVTKVNDAVNRAEVESKNCSGDDVCTVTIHLDKKAFEKMIGVQVLR